MESVRDWNAPDISELDREKFIQENYGEPLCVTPLLTGVRLAFFVDEHEVLQCKPYGFAYDVPRGIAYTVAKEYDLHDAIQKCNLRCATYVVFYGTASEHMFSITDIYDRVHDAYFDYNTLADQCTMLKLQRDIVYTDQLMLTESYDNFVEQLNKHAYDEHWGLYVKPCYHPEGFVSAKSLMRFKVLNENGKNEQTDQTE